MSVGLIQGVTKRCRRLSWLTNSALKYASPNVGGWGIAGSQPKSKAVHITWHGAQINFGYLTPYLTYGLTVSPSLLLYREKKKQRERLGRLTISLFADGSGKKPGNFATNGEIVMVAFWFHVYSDKNFSSVVKTLFVFLSNICLQSSQRSRSFDS